MVDLDAALVKISQDHLPYWDGTLEDPRLELHIGDALAWLREHDDFYDVVILDLPDCTSETAMLYRPPIFELVRSRLANNRDCDCDCDQDLSYPILTLTLTN